MSKRSRKTTTTVGAPSSGLPTANTDIHALLLSVTQTLSEVRLAQDAAMEEIKSLRRSSEERLDELTKEISTFRQEMYAANKRLEAMEKALNIKEKAPSDATKVAATLRRSSTRSKGSSQAMSSSTLDQSPSLASLPVPSAASTLRSIIPTRSPSTPSSAQPTIVAGSSSQEASSSHPTPAQSAPSLPMAPVSPPEKSAPNLQLATSSRNFRRLKREKTWFGSDVPSRALTREPAFIMDESEVIEGRSTSFKTSSMRDTDGSGSRKRSRDDTDEQPSTSSRIHTSSAESMPPPKRKKLHRSTKGPPSE